MLKIRNYTVLPALPEVLNDLQALAVNLFWSWNSELIDLFSRIDPAMWNTCGHNPVKLLGNVSQERLNALAENQGFLAELKKRPTNFNHISKGRRGFKAFVPNQPK